MLASTVSSAVSKQIHHEVKQDLKSKTHLRSKLKKEIQKWISDYELENGRPPTDSDLEPIRPLFLQRKSLEKAIKTLKSHKDHSPQTPFISSSPSKFSVENLRLRRTSYMNSRMSEIAAELAEDDIDGDAIDKKKESKWGMLKNVFDLPMAEVVEEESSIRLPEGVKLSDLKTIKVPDFSVQLDEDFLRSSEIRPPPRPNKLETIVLEKLSDSRLPEEYVDDFEIEAPENEMILTSIPIEVLEEREKTMEFERLKSAQKEITRFQTRERDLAYRENVARKRVNEIEDDAWSHVRNLRIHASRDFWLARCALKRRFTDARMRLEKSLHTQKAFLKEKFGRLKLQDRSAARRYEIMWDKVPQPVEVRVHMIRNVSSKLRRGDYVVMMSIYERLGGQVMKWGRMPKNFGLKNDDNINHKSSATSPIHYSGKFYSRELRFDESIYGLCPSPCDVLPGNCIIFELYEIGENGRKSEVVAWSVLPMCDPHFRIIHGRFRLPFLRGPVDRNIKKYSTFEERYARDLSWWMGNMYIDVRHLGREFEGESNNEVEFEVDYVNSEVKVREDDIDGEEEEAVVNPMIEAGNSDSSEKENTPNPEADSIVNKSKTSNNPWQEKAATIFKKGKKGEDGGKKRKRRRGRKKSNKVAVVTPGEENSDEEYHSDVSDGEDGGRVLSKSDKSVLPGSEIPSDTTNNNQKKKSGMSDWTDVGLGIKRGQSKKERIIEHVWHTLTDTQEMEGYTYAVENDPNLTYKPSPDRVLNRKLTYLFSELTEDLNAHSFLTVEFFCTLIVLACTFWLRMYFHYMAQWLYLKAIGVPLFGFRFTAMSIIIKYTSSNIRDWQEIGLVAVGHAANTAILAIATGVSVSLSFALDSLPYIVSKFVIAFGTMTVLDPLLIFIVDLFRGNWACESRGGECERDYTSDGCECVTGDFAKLYERFERIEASGMSGAFYVLVLDVFGTLLSFGVLYNYILLAHMNGRMLDIYKRINDTEEGFFVPDDEEISEEGLRNIVTKSRRWRGPGGTVRKIHVNTFKVKDDRDKHFEESLTHIAIFAVEVDGNKTLYRHFLRQANGSLIEIGEDIEQHFSGQIALEKLMGGVEDGGEEEEKKMDESTSGGWEGGGNTTNFEKEGMDFITQGNVDEFENKKFN
ncbi:hypothetical protein TrLO_g5556 [Triparma laevis f. longispina]|uniref:Uncharacterized protein n=1 Tax=Triparma laevis f. longispina TaxID=1714387 RepID=A0A9W7C620_9STRA|nr:hypothetical protein TrLO_g5556 [Triparma laevis f. longispina]